MKEPGGAEMGGRQFDDDVGGGDLIWRRSISSTRMLQILTRLTDGCGKLGCLEEEEEEEEEFFCHVTKQ